MTHHSEVLPLLKGLDISAFNISSLDDEILVDKLCVDLLKHLFLHLTRQAGLEPEQAGELCHGADYFLREFIIADRNDNLFEISPERVRQFAGHWYIIRTLEPNMVELSRILAGIDVCYGFLAGQGLISANLAQSVSKICREHAVFARRIEDFWSLQEGGYDAWRAECPLDEPGPA